MEFLKIILKIIFKLLFFTHKNCDKYSDIIFKFKKIKIAANKLQQPWSLVFDKFELLIELLLYLVSDNSRLVKEKNLNSLFFYPSAISNGYLETPIPIPNVYGAGTDIDRRIQYFHYIYF